MELTLAIYTLWRRELAQFLRQRSRIVGALGTPIVFWVLLGSGLGSSFSVGNLGVPAGGYLEYFYPGTLALILLFTAIFSTISVIEDRHDGFLQGVLVAPVPAECNCSGQDPRRNDASAPASVVIPLPCTIGQHTNQYRERPAITGRASHTCVRIDKPWFCIGMDA